jgi:hypothetical protein
LSDDDLVLVHYGEAGDAAGETHLAACADCRRRLEEIGRVLVAADALPVPERSDDYGAEVWRRLAPELRRKPLSFLRRPALRRWGTVAALAASLVVAFVLGRQSAPPTTPLSAPVRERILLVAIGDHLERSQMILVELTNADPSRPLDIAPEQRLAQELVGANRLYRQTAVSAGETGVADVLDELERMLLEIAHSPKDLNAAEVKTLQQRIAARGILFKVRVVGSRVREREKEAVGPMGTAVS